MRKAILRLKSIVLDQVLTMAFELSDKNWKVIFSHGGKNRFYNVYPDESRTRVPEIVARAKKKFGLPEDCRVFSCYEAGRDGFWVHRFLVSLGIENLVIDPASIEVPRKHRRTKTDRVDAEKLVGLLIRHLRGEEKNVLKVVAVPSEKDEDEMRLHREREKCVSERTRLRNRIRSLLVTQGVRMGSWKEVNAAYIERVLKWNGEKLGPKLQDALKRNIARMEFVDAQIKELDQEIRKFVNDKDPCEAVKKMQKLHGLKGVGIQGARILVAEFFGWRTFDGGKQVGALAGLTGCPYASGEMEREQGISKSGNYRIRTLMVEMAWSWQRFQPHSRLSRWFKERFGQGRRHRRIGIVALARKLLVALWRYVEFGIVPEGAVVVR